MLRPLGTMMLLLCCGCSLQSVAAGGERGVYGLSCVEPGSETQTIYVVNLGWHTGIIVANDTLKAHSQQLAATAEGRWTEYGWGDADFYRASGYSWWRGLRASTELGVSMPRMVVSRFSIRVTRG